MNLIKLVASKNDEGRTLFKYLVRYFNNVPVTKIEKIFRLKDVKINGKKTNNKNYQIQEKDEIWIYGLEVEDDDSLQIKIPINFKVIFEDDNILIVDKPINVPIHSDEHSLDMQVLSYLNFKKIDSFVPSHVGRIDKSTSGIVIYAKNYRSLVELNKKTCYFEKYYLLKSDFPWEKKHVVLYAEYNKKNNKFILKDNPPGTKMETIFFQDRNRKYARIITGKKHQIRFTLQHLGYPIKGDRRYGGQYGTRIFLHSHKIVFHKLENNLEYLNDISFISDIKW